VTGGDGHAGGGRVRGEQGLVGRDAERAVAGIAIDRALAGSPQLVVVEGEPGVGKSAMARAVASMMPAGSVALWARSEEFERQLDFGIVDQLIREAGAAGLSAPPTIQRGGARPDPLAVGEVILGLTEEHSRDRALLVVIDDAQWADLVSMQALSFVYRRLHDRRALLLIVQRPGSVHLEPFDRLVRDGRGHRLRLAPLAVPAVIELVRARAGLMLTTRAAERLHAHTGGNPLATLALVDELDPVALTTGFGPLPAPRTYATMVLGRLAGCSPETEHLVAAVAVTGAVELEELARMIEAGDLAAPLSEAVGHGLVEVQVRGGRRVVDVAHPLVRAAVLGDLAPGRLCALHAAAAGALGDTDRTFRHELRSHLGRCPELAAEGTRRAYARLADGWELAAVELLVTAAELLGPGAARSEALLQASHWLLTAGDTVAAAELLGSAGGAGTPLDRLVRGEVAMLEGDHRAARRLLEDAVSASATPDVAAKAAGLLATLAANAGRAADTIEWARRALTLSVESGTDTAYAMTMLVSGWAMEGALADADDEVAVWASRMGPAADGPDVRYARGVLALWDGRLEEAEHALATMLDDRRVAGRGLIAASTRYALADCWYRQGRWDEAVAMAEDVASTLDDSGQLLSSPMAHSVAAYVLAGRGQLDGARRHVAAAEQAMTATGNIAASLWLVTATARVAIAAGDDGAVVDTLLALAGALRGAGLPEGVQPWRADLVVALVKQGRLDDAERELGDLRARVHAGGAHARAGLARAAGIVAAARGDQAAAATAFATGLTDDPVSSGPFARALLELAAGAFERRQGSRRRAAELLDHAIDRFERLGATPFLTSARQEREACGVDARSGADAAHALTKAEAAVASLVADGRTNREVAASLVLSVKTVESHLARIYDKVGVRSRTELAIEWRAGTVAAAGDA
jgi:DNA-binding NarL/FixJ family response regulator/tetratricopeptide (TPR) repeat protein